MSERRSMGSGLGATMLAMLLVASCSNGEPEPIGTSPTDAVESSPTAGVESPASDVSILDDCPELPCEGPLEPAKYRWTFSEPMIDFEITSPGWTWLYAGGGLHLIADETPPPQHQSLFVPDGIYFLHDPTIASQDCEESSEPGVGGSVSDLVGWLETAPGLLVSEATQVTVGGLDGTHLDFEIDPKWKGTCPFSEGLPAVPLIFNGAAPLGGYHWAIVPGQSMRWYILDSEDGVMIVDLEDAPGGLKHNELLANAADVVDSLVISWPS
jgi:hypothetical protein